MMTNTRSITFLISLLILACILGIGSYGIDDSSSMSENEVGIVIENGTILTMNEERDIIDNGFVAIRENEITAVKDSKYRDNYDAKSVINADGDIVMPGLINTHNHASMTVFRSLADDVKDRLERYIFPLEQELVSPRMVRTGAQLGNIEMIKGGVTTYADMYYFEEEVAETVDKIGMRAVLGETVINFPVADADSAQEGIQNTLRFIESYKDHPRITPAFAPHAPYTNTTETLKEVTRLSLDHDVPVLIHLAESDQENEVIAERSGGKSPVEYMSDIGALTPNLVAAHVINVDSSGLSLLKENNVGVAHNMSANIKSAKGVAPVPEMLTRGIEVGLGTDGPMSGNTLSTIDELSQVAKVHKLVNKDRSIMPPIKVVEMATIGAARVLNMGDKIGSLEEGKLADVIVIDTKSPNMVPMYNIYSSLVYSAYPSNVRHTLVNGKVIMKEREMETIDEASVHEKIRKFEDKVISVVEEIGEVVK